MNYHKFSELFPMMNAAEYKSLLDDMQKHGYRKECPIVTCDGAILDGRNRYKAALELGLQPLFTAYNGNDPLAYVISTNINRRHLNETQRAGVAARLATLKHGGDRKSDQGANLHLDNERGVTIAQAAKDLNVSVRTVKSYRAVAEDAPELVEKMDSGEMTANAATTEIKRKQNRANLESVEAQESKAVQGVYDVIVIDPPWPMEKIERDVAPNQVAFEYPTMSVDKISHLEIPCADDCHVFLWTTHKFLPNALSLLAAWDMKYVCTFVWHKPGGFQPFGLPQYNSEFCLYARKGTPKFIDTKDFMTCFNAPRGAHSEKPEKFYETLRRVTAGRRLDMFNRRTIGGFDGWGKEAK